MPRRLTGKSMKIGILTFHFACNYGAVLQTLALKRTLEQLGAAVDVIDYLPQELQIPSARNGWGLWCPGQPGQLGNAGLRIRRAPFFKREFDTFRKKHLSLSKRCRTLDEVGAVAEQYDAIIAGSDQIWHFSRSPVYFLEWGSHYDGLRISYAPSCAYPGQSAGENANIKRWIRQIDSLSVRDNFSRDMIQEVSGRIPEVVADPTLLADLSDLQQPVNLPFKEYILMYALGESVAGWADRVVPAIRRRVGNLPVVAVVSSITNPRPCPCADVVLWKASPEQWMYLIKHAAFVFTDSFHGVLFAAKARRPLLAGFLEKGRAPRLMDLAVRYRLEDVIASSKEEAVRKIEMEPFCYEEATRLMHTHAEQSIRFLRTALAGRSSAQPPQLKV